MAKSAHKIMLLLQLLFILNPINAVFTRVLPVSDLMLTLDSDRPSEPLVPRRFKWSQR